MTGRLPCPTRVEVRESVICPKCNARVGEECFDSPNASRDANHIERVKLAIAYLGEAVQR